MQPCPEIGLHKSASSTSEGLVAFLTAKLCKVLRTQEIAHHAQGIPTAIIIVVTKKILIKTVITVIIRIITIIVRTEILLIFADGSTESSL